MNTTHDVIIIGAGIAGTAAAAQAAAAGLNALVLHKPGDKGYWAKIAKLSNIPGFPETISGGQLLERLKKQAEQAGAAFQETEVTNLEAQEPRLWRVKSGADKTYLTTSVIVATGISKGNHFLVGEQELAGNGVYYSSNVEARLLKHQAVCVIGRTQEAARAALELAKSAEKIYFVIPGNKLDVPEGVVQELENCKKCEMLFSSSIKKLNGNEELSSVTILSAGSEKELRVRAVFIYTHPLTPVLNMLNGLVAVDSESGRPLLQQNMETSQGGIFACGDVVCGSRQHPAVSMAQGVIAAINVEKFLRG